MKTNASTDPSKLMPASGRGNSLELALEVSELRYRRLFETAQDGILILDADSGKIIDVNPFLLDLLDYPFESIIGLQLWEIGLFEDIAANQAAFAKLQTEEYIRYENHPLRTKTGKQIQVEFVSNVYFVGSAKVIQCNIRDISARAEFQAASKSHADTLELAARAREKVIAVFSHELRTPLAAISSMIDVLELGHGAVGMPDKRELPPQFDKSALAFIRRNVQGLVHLVADLLDFTHIADEALGLELVKVDAHEVIRFALKNLESQHKGAGIGIDLQLQAVHSHIRADSGKLEQILSNLIGNALKFTPKGGKISIVTRNEESGRLVIEVSDTGIGIPADALSRIFSPFEQGDSSIHSRYGGLGLGLSIARTLMKAHGGTLEVESEGSGQGAKFTARFKIDDSASREATQADALSDLTGQGLRIESSPPSDAKTGVATSINSANGVATGSNGVTETTTTTTESTGVVTEFTPGQSLFLKTEAAQPVPYKFGKTVTYVTSDGRVIEASKIKKDSKVRVHYIKDGDDIVVDKVIVTRDRD